MDAGQGIVERELEMPRIDGPLTPVNQAFAEGGWWCVFLGHVLLGRLLWYVSAVAGRVSAGRLCLLACCWGAFSQIEVDLVTGILVSLRSAAVLGATAFLVSLGFRRLKSRPNPVRTWRMFQSVPHNRGLGKTDWFVH